MKTKTYLICSFLLIGLVLGFVFGFNYRVDPFGVYNKYREYSYNWHKPEFGLNTRTLKVFNSLDVKPNVIFLGSSRIEYLVPDEAYKKHSDLVCYNLGLSGATVCETEGVYDFAQRNFDLKEVYYQLDFYTVTNRYPDYSQGFDQDLLTGKKSPLIEKCKMYLTWLGVEKSMACLKQNAEDPEGSFITYHYNNVGSRTNAYRYSQLKLHGDSILDYEIERILAEYIEIYNDSTLMINEAKENALSSLLLKLVNAKHKSTVFIGPIMNRQYQLLLVSRAYPLYVDFLKQVIEHGHKFVYFGGDNEFTSDKNLFWDSHHARKTMGELIMPYVFGDKVSARNDYFGVVINEQNIESLLSYIETDRVKYLNEPK